MFNAPAICTRCEQWTLEVAPVECSLEVEGHVFTTLLPGRRCRHCGHVRCAPAPLARFRLLVARELLESGMRAGAVLGFAREACGMTHEDLARLLDLTPAQLQGWEQREVVYRGALEVVAAQVRSRLGGSAPGPELGVLGTPRPLPAKVDLDLFGARPDAEVRFAASGPDAEVRFAASGPDAEVRFAASGAALAAR